MAFDPPKIGAVIAFPYVWSNEHLRGVHLGQKVRPVAVISTREHAGKTQLYVIPFTHAAPHTPQQGIELPAALHPELGFDGKRNWIRTGEMNRFEWPSPDRPGRSTESITYGTLPGPFVTHLRQHLSQRVRMRNVALVDRQIDLRGAFHELRESLDGTQLVARARGQAQAWLRGRQPIPQQENAVVEEHRDLQR